MGIHREVRAFFICIYCLLFFISIFFEKSVISVIRKEIGFEKSEFHIIGDRGEANTQITFSMHITF